MKRLLKVALALLLTSPVLACPPRAVFCSPHLKHSVTEGAGGYASFSKGIDGRSIRLGTIDTDCCLVSDTGKFVAVANYHSLRLFTPGGKTLNTISLAPYFGSQFIGGWLEDDGSSYWESKRGELWHWSLSTCTLAKVDSSQIPTLILRDQASPVSRIRLAISHRIELAPDKVLPSKALLKEQMGGREALELFEACSVKGARQQLLARLAAKGRQHIYKTSSRRPSEWEKEFARQPVLPTPLQNLYYADQTGYVPAWLVESSDLIAMQAYAAKDPKVFKCYLSLRSLKPELPISDELIDMVDHGLRTFESARNCAYVDLLTQSGASPAQLSKLLHVDFPDPEQLLNYFGQVACLEAIPALIELLPKQPLLARQALYRQLRVDLGDDPAAWTAWISQKHHDTAERGQKLVEQGDSGGLLWLGRDANVRFSAQSAPRLVQRISAEGCSDLWVTQDRVVRKALVVPMKDWCWDLPSGLSRWPVTESEGTTYLGLTTSKGQYLLERRVESKLGLVWFDGVATRQVDQAAARKTPEIVNLLRDWERSRFQRESHNQASIFYINSHDPRLDPESILDPTTSEPYGCLVSNSQSPNGRWNVLRVPNSNADGSTFLLWDFVQRKLVPECKIPSKLNIFVTGPVEDGVPQWFSPDSRWLAIGTEKLTLVSTDGDAPHTVGTQAIRARSLAFQPKAERLAVGSENELVLLHLPDLKVEQIIRGLGPVNGLAYSPDGSLLAVALQDEIRVYQTNSPWPTQEGQDPQLLSELWTGMRLSGGAAVRLSEAEFKQRLVRWKSETGSDWWNGCPKPISQPGRAEFPPLALAGLAVSASFLGYSLWQRRRSR